MIGNTTIKLMLVVLMAACPAVAAAGEDPPAPPAESPETQARPAGDSGEGKISVPRKIAGVGVLGFLVVWLFTRDMWTRRNKGGNPENLPGDDESREDGSKDESHP